MIVTDIQRFSLHDGPGIRTTVFLKGCNMHCGWCHNPETIALAPQVQFFSEKCIGCGECVRACKTGALTAEGYSRGRCTACFACVQACFAEARVRVGRSCTPQELCDEIICDRPYFIDSGGGVTVSGGEPFVQAGELGEFLALCRQNGISTAVETNLSAPWKTIEALLPVLDLVMFDIKLFDEEQHRLWTGISNRTTLENARRLDATGKPFIVRTPVIFDVTYGEVPKIAQFLSDMRHLMYYELLPYNPLAEEKFHRLGLQCRTEGSKIPQKRQMLELLEQVRATGVKARLMEE